MNSHRVQEPTSKMTKGVVSHDADRVRQDLQAMVEVSFETGVPVAVVNALHDNLVAGAAGQTLQRVPAPCVGARTTHQFTVTDAGLKGQR